MIRTQIMNLCHQRAGHLRPELPGSMALHHKAAPPFSLYRAIPAGVPAGPLHGSSQNLPTAMAPSWSEPTNGATNVSALPIKYHW
jgi:hypothetical protein